MTRSNLPSYQANWPVRLRELCQSLQDDADAAQKDAARGEAWLLLNSSIFRYLRYQRIRLGGVETADLEDIAAQKSLDLLQKSEQGTWDLTDRSPGEITSFLATVARNGLMDLMRYKGRQLLHDPVEDPDFNVSGPDPTRTANTAVRDATTRGTADRPSLRVERREFVEALRICAEELQPRSRQVWLFRVFLDMPSKEIAIHPEVGLEPSHVDVILQRAREAVRACMAGKGYRPQDMPPGTFVMLWKTFRLEKVEVSRPSSG